MTDSETLLLVDDDPMVLGVTRRMVEAAGARGVLATSGEEALAAATRMAAEGSAGDISAVLIDVSMPGLAGAELAVSLRAAGSAAPMILTSGYAEDAATPGSRSAAIASFISKPYSQHDLVAALAAATAP